MTTLAITIGSLTAQDASNNRTATYTKSSGPDWATVGSDGAIDLTHPSDTNAPAIDLQFTLPSGHLFASSSAFTTNPASADFSVTSGAGTATLTVSDSNNDAVNTPYEYTLHLSDGTKIDPRVINH